jgi:hypothetical protein
MLRGIPARLGLIIGVVVAFLMPSAASASAFVRGAYYRLGEDDPGAIAGHIGNDPTKDSFADKLDLARTGQPLYSSDVSPSAPSTLSMAFANVGGPAEFYSRATPLDMSQEGYALETWVKLSLPVADPPVSHLIAYNGDPASNGFGFYFHDGQYVLKIGSFEKALGTATYGQWHHLAFVHEFSNNSYFFDGKSVGDTTSDPTPITATGGFWLGGRPVGGGSTDLFNGLIDETRYQTFNPLAAGSFDPTNFLIVPEPAMLGVITMGLLILSSRHATRKPKQGHERAD